MSMRHFLTLSLVILTSSCATNASTGLISGGIVGASAGGLAHQGTGAIIGSTVGLVAGSLVGLILDEQDRRVMEKSSPRTVDRMDRNEALTINDIIKLSQSGVSDETIVRYIHETSSTYRLSQAQVRRLQDSGVSQRVINEMIDSGK